MDAYEMLDWAWRIIISAMLVEWGKDCIDAIKGDNMAIIKFKNGSTIKMAGEIKPGAVLRGGPNMFQAFAVARAIDENPNQGVKLDGGKLRYDLVAQDAQAGMTKILTFGANKYGDRNWEKGMKWSRLFAAAMRHLWAWFGGEDNDAESGESHLDHAACCIHMLSAFVKREAMHVHDDRPVQPAPIVNNADMSKERGYAAAEFKQPDELAGYIGPKIQRVCVTCKRETWSSGRGPCKRCLESDNLSEWVAK